MNNRVLLTITSFAAFMATGVANPVNSLYLEFLGASFSAIGLLGTVTAFTSIILSFVWGRTSDRTGKRKGILLIGLLGLAACNGLISIVPSYLYLFPLRLLSGAFLSAYATASLAMMGDELESHESTRGRKMGTFRGLSSLGFGLMAFLSGSIADRFSLRMPFVLAALFYIVALVFAAAVKEAGTEMTAKPSVENPFRSLAAVIRLWKNEGRTTDTETDSPNLPLSPLLVSALLWSLVVGAVYAVWANYMVSEIGYTATAMSRLWSLASTSEFPLMILAGWLSDKIGRLKMLTIGLLAWAVVFLGYVFTPWMPWIIFIQLTRGFAYSAFTAAAMTYAAEVRSRSKRGSVSGAYNAAGGIGSVLGAAMGGIQTQLMGFRAMIGTNAGLIFAAAVYLLSVIVRRKKRL
ncbi:MAG: MFS transporter [Spirochaetales bacterium]|nr:MFS transporter [Spirochaetales bacterium]